MGRVQLYIAQSLDGYIADKEGGVAWLEAYGAEGEDHGYGAFFAEVGALAIGATTYEQVLGWGWPYAEKPTWVFTHRELPVPDGADVRFTQAPVDEVVAEIRRETSGNLWVVGGGVLVKHFLDARLVDDVMIAVVPELLGDGIPLFPGVLPAKLELVHAKPFKTGIVELRYTVRAR